MKTASAMLIGAFVGFVVGLSLQWLYPLCVLGFPFTFAAAAETFRTIDWLVIRFLVGLFAFFGALVRLMSVDNGPLREGLRAFSFLGDVLELFTFWL